MIAISGTAATSWKSSTAKLARPPSVWVSFFSFSVCSTIAVDDSARMIPTATAAFHGRPSGEAAAGDQRDASGHLQPAEPDQPMPHLPEHRAAAARVRSGTASAPRRTRRTAGRARSRARPARAPARSPCRRRDSRAPTRSRAAAERHRDHGRRQIDRHLQQDALHASPPGSVGHPWAGDGAAESRGSDLPVEAAPRHPHRIARQPPMSASRCSDIAARRVRSRCRDLAATSEGEGAGGPGTRARPWRRAAACRESMLMVLLRLRSRPVRDRTGPG